MSEPHFFVTSRGVINLNRIVYAELAGEPLVTMPETGTVVRFEPPDGPRMTVFLDQGEFRLEGEEEVGEFMSLCARYHRCDRKEAWPEGTQPGLMDMVDQETKAAIGKWPVEKGKS